MVKGFIMRMMLGSRSSNPRHIWDQLMDRLIWKDMYIVWDKMKDETDELRESLKSYCKLPVPHTGRKAELQVSPGHHLTNPTLPKFQTM